MNRSFGMGYVTRVLQNVEGLANLILLPLYKDDAIRYHLKGWTFLEGQYLGSFQP